MNPILLLHGALGSSAQMAPLQDRFAGRVIHTLDFAGHGSKAGTSGHFDIQQLVRQVIEWMDAAGIAQVDIFGYSMGGYVGLFLAYNHPERVGRVATLGTKLLWTSEYAQTQQRMLNPATIEAKVPKFARALADRHGGAHWKGLLEQTAAMMTGLGAQPALDDEAFGRISQPVMLLVGDRDDTVSVVETLAVCQALPVAALGVLPATGHPLERVDAAALGALLRGFFDIAGAWSEG